MLDQAQDAILVRDLDEKMTEAALAGRGYDLAILDLMMPGMDGFGVATAIQEIASWAHYRSCY